MYLDRPPLSLLRAAQLWALVLGLAQAPWEAHKIGLEHYQVGYEAFSPNYPNYCRVLYLGSKAQPAGWPQQLREPPLP